MTDTTLSLAARLAANLIVDAINLAKPGARLAGKIGDRALNLIGGPAFSERDAQRFLLDGADALNKVEAQVDSLKPWYSDGGPTEWMALNTMDSTNPDGRRFIPASVSSPSGQPDWKSVSFKDIPKSEPRGTTVYIRDYAPPAHGFNTMPNWHAPQSSAPVAPKPTDVADSPGVASTPRDATPGHLTIWRKVSCPTCRAIAGLACEDDDGYRRPDVIHPTRIAAFDTRDATQTTTQARDPECGCAMTESSQANCPLHGYNGTLDNDETPEQPVGAGVAEPGTGEADLICRVMSQHWFHVDSGDKPFEYSYSCRSPMGEPCETFPIRGYPGAIEAWQSHVAPLILAALNAQK